MRKVLMPFEICLNLKFSNNRKLNGNTAEGGLVNAVNKFSLAGDSSLRIPMTDYGK
jgi:hypothetical protein